MARLALTHATVVTVNEQNDVINDGTIVVDNDTIVYVGSAADAPALDAATTVIDADGGIVMPGLVNAHAHLAMTLFRGLADDMDLDGFLGKLLPIEGRTLNHETVLLGSQLAVAECLRAGITTALDMYFFPEATTEAAHVGGFRLANGPVFIEFPGPDNRPFPDRLAWAREQLEAGATWLQPHSSYLLDRDQLAAIAALADEFGAWINVHSSETAAEMSTVHQRHGSTPTAILAETGLLSNRTVCAHGVHVTDTDIDLLAAAGATVAHCPASNLKLASGIARLREMRAAGVNVALGTDGAASANDLDLFQAMRLAGYVQKGVRSDATLLPAVDLVRIATINGARALGLGDLIGSIEVGKRADLVVLDAASAAMHPVFDPHSVIAASASRADVRDVIVDGKVVVRSGGVQTLDVRRIVGEIDEFARNLAM